MCERGPLDRFHNLRIEIGNRDFTDASTKAFDDGNGRQGSGDGFNDALLEKIFGLLVVWIVWGDVLFGDRD